MHKLCMVSSASRNSKKTLEEIDFVRSLEFLEEAEERMHEIAGGIGTSEYGRGVDNILTYLRNAPGRVTKTQLMERFVHQHSFEELMRILFALESAGRVKLSRFKTGARDALGREVVDIAVKYGREEKETTS